MHIEQKYYIALNSAKLVQTSGKNRPLVTEIPGDTSVCSHSCPFILDCNVTWQEKTKIGRNIIELMHSMYRIFLGHNAIRKTGHINK